MPSTQSFDVTFVMVLLVSACQICCDNNNKECNSQLFTHTGFPDNDIAKVYVTDAFYCQIICTYLCDCQFFTFNEENSPATCYLKNYVTGEPPCNDSGGNKTSGYSLSHCLTRECSMQTRLQDGNKVYNKSAQYDICPSSPNCSSASTMAACSKSDCKSVNFCQSSSNISITFQLNVTCSDKENVICECYLNVSKTGNRNTVVEVSVQCSDIPESSTTTGSGTLTTAEMTLSDIPESSTTTGSGTLTTAEMTLSGTKSNDSLHLVTETLTWTEALQYCRCNYTDLVSIPSPAAQNNVTEFIKMNNITKDGIWIGLRNHRIWDYWYWSNKDQFNYTAWGEGEPSDLVYERCGVGILDANLTFYWKNACCQTRKAFLCYGSKICK
ncbi:plasma kallikrein-like [Protopterus annectens]|uniref:plasma kallikrein-like n=1 Tax=Protopterus annectens TaxID=7888 RepID=UPI001CFBED23|nr:plasma kallikrein-like [Protopterus annectens]